MGLPPAQPLLLGQTGQWWGAPAYLLHPGGELSLASSLATPSHLLPNSPTSPNSALVSKAEIKTHPAPSGGRGCTRGAPQPPETPFITITALPRG